MALIVNGVTIPSSGVVTYNGVSLDKVICNGVTVFKKEIREPASGELFVAFNTSWNVLSSGESTILWNGALYGAIPKGQTSGIFGDYTYYRGTYRGVSYGSSMYGVYRIKN